MTKSCLAKLPDAKRPFEERDSAGADENVPTDNVAVRDVVVELKLLCCRSNTRRVPCLRMAEWMPLAALLKLPASLISFALVVRQASSTIVLWRAVSHAKIKNESRQPLDVSRSVCVLML